MKLTTPEHIAAITPYPPGKPMDELERQYGVSNSIKLASNENPWGPSPLAVRAMRSELLGLHRYPDGSSYYLTEAIAEENGLDPEEVVLGNGSNEIIEFLVKAFVKEGDEVITSHPSFLMYQKFVQIRGGTNHVVALNEMEHDLIAIKEKVGPKTRLIFLDNPNNPTGTVIAPSKLYSFFSDLPEEVVVVLDEAYVDYLDMEYKLDIYSLIRNCENRCAIVFMRTFSKAYGLAGLRVGFGLMAREIAQVLHKVRQPFNINLLGQVGALAALADKQYYDQVLEKTRLGIAYLQQKVEEMGCKAYPTHTNFFLIDVGGSAGKLYEAMLYQGVIIRSMEAYGFPSLIRITVGTSAENDRFLSAFKICLKELGYVG